MKTNILGRTGMVVNPVGLGCEHLEKLPYEQVKAVVDAALDAGINIFDVFMSEPNVRSYIGRALEGRREQVILQGHLCAVWENGQYKRSRNIEDVKHFFTDFMTRMNTDYVDIGMIHLVDTQEDFDIIFGGEIIEYAKQLKEQGVIRCIGLSSHNPVIALQAVQTGLIDVLMFSLNPAYDLLPENTALGDVFKADTFKQKGLEGINDVRAKLYATCEQMGVAITVMKGLGAGSLLKAETSPFGVALTVTQCIQYALDRPGVAAMMVGCRTPEEVQIAIDYQNATEEQRDYSVLLGTDPKYSLAGKCMYCNHCLPCVMGIDIAAVNKYLDLADQSGVTPTLQAHYNDLQTTASDCIGCGDCETRCPFGVGIVSRMEKAAKLFG